MSIVIVRNTFMSIMILSVMALMNACNGENSSDNSANTISSPDMNPAASADETSKPVAVKKKGKAKVIINKQNGMKVEKGKDGIYTNAEVMPEFPGGEAALSKFVEDNIDYPQDAIDVNKEGTVRVSFVIDEKGNVVKPATEGTALGDGLDEEAVKVVNQSPAWKPGTVKGKPVKTRLTLPITFQLADS